MPERQLLLGTSVFQMLKTHRRLFKPRSLLRVVPRTEQVTSAGIEEIVSFWLFCTLSGVKITSYKIKLKMGWPVLDSFGVA